MKTYVTETGVVIAAYCIVIYCIVILASSILWAGILTIDKDREMCTYFTRVEYVVPINPIACWLSEKEGE